MFGISLARISLLTGTSLSGGAGVSPTLDLNFRGQGYSAAMAGYTFNQLIDFTRTSAATYVDATGKIVPTAASRNLLTFTQEFDNAAWAKTSATVTANSVAAPDGLMTADTLTAAAGSGIAPLMIQTGTTVASTIYTASIFVRAGTHTFVQMYIGSQSADWCNFTLSGSGSVQNNGAALGAISFDSATGYYRISMTYTAGGTDRRPGIALVPSGTATRVQTGTYAGTETIHLWGAQLEVGSTATSYVRNFGGLFPPRFDYDPVTLQPRGLLIEEQRTNLLLQSEDLSSATWGKTNITVSANSVVSPSGTLTADKIIPSAVSGLHNVYQSTGEAVNNGTHYAETVFAKADGYSQIRISIASVSGFYATFDLNTGTVTDSGGLYGGSAPTGAVITAFPNGWYRLEVSGTFNSANTGFGSSVTYNVLSGGSDTFTGDGTSGVLLWGAQQEAGSFATSYIPTVASQVTRTADRASIVSPNFSSWFNQSEGTIVVDASSLVAGSGSNRFSIIISDGTADNRYSIFYDSAGGRYFAVTALAAGQANIVSGGLTAANTPDKIACAYKANDFAVSSNGGSVSTDTSGSLPVVDRILIGSFGFSYFNGHIRRISYYPTRLTNAQLQALTA